jgi:hypothetical protein
MMSSEVNVVALVRGEEQYIFVFDETNRTETLRILGRYAADPQLSFTWFDAAVLSQRVRELLPAKSINAGNSSNHVSASASSISMEMESSQVKTKPSPRFKI